ncbi:hypothetical protein ACWM35_21530 [Neobacillus sp. K501]
MNWQFDWNECFMIVTSIIAFSIMLLLRKHFHNITFIIIWIYSVAFVQTVDYFLAASPFRVYYCADNITYEPAGAMIHLFLYPAFSFIFLFFYDRWNISGKNLILYLLVWDIFSIFFEWLNVINGVFTYTSWHIYYSIFVYPVSSLLLIKVYLFVKTQLMKPIPASPIKP